MAILLPYHAIEDVRAITDSISELESTCKELTCQNSVYHAHETTSVDPFAIALLCGDVRADVSLDHGQGTCVNDC